MNGGPTYRRDIDGLRAVAVLSVLFYHFGIAPFSGGFVGVDIFFVISGYLITSILVRESPSLLAFYERRIRRIFPALFAMLICSTVLALVVLPPERLIEYGKSLLAAVTFSSNLFFWRGTNYFATSHEHLLLHTWSLAVEEQFYLLFPIFIWAVKRKPLAWILAAASASLALSLWATEYRPGAAFYLAPVRAWELLLGSALAIQKINIGFRGRYTLSWIGAFLTIYGIVFITPNDPFPGFAALAPCFGAAMLIAAGGTTHAGRVLSTEPMVFVGKISYSLYLWHWPILVAYRFWLLRELAAWEVVILFGVSFCLATLSWIFVEQPFRRKRIPYLFRWSAIASCAAVVVAVSLLYLNGVPERFPNAVVQLGSKNINASRICQQAPPTGIEMGEVCFLGTGSPRVVVWGDSHAVVLSEVIHQAAISARVGVLHVSYVGCPPSLNVYRADLRAWHACDKFNEMVLQYIRVAGIKDVVLIAYWAGYALGNPGRESDPPFLAARGSSDHSNRDSSRSALREGVLLLVRTLNAEGINGNVFLQVPEFPVNVPRFAMRHALNWEDQPLSLALADHKYRLSLALPTIRSVMDPFPYLCRENLCSSTDGSSLMYMDSHHLSKQGAAKLLPMFSSYFLSIQ